MVERDVIAATEAQWYQARNRMKQLGVQSAVVSVLLIAVGSFGASLLAAQLGTSQGRALATTAMMLGTAIPVTGLLWWRMDRQQRHSNQLMKTLRRQLNNAIDEVESESGRRQLLLQRQDFERRLASALEMAEGEPEVIEVIERALTALAPGTPAELLLADNSRSHLSRVAGVSPNGQLPSCSVTSPDHCPAARRSQVQRFADSDALDACPKLRQRGAGRCSAVCVPVSIMGRGVGVLHIVSEAEAPLESTQVQDLGTLADLVGARIGMLRMIAESQLQASTDSLTGLLNRRSMENKVREARRDTGRIAVVLADLDHFKQLNDTYGHHTGDRALRLFAGVLAAALRRQDLISRHGGEEFLAVLPDCTGSLAETVLETVRTELAAAVAEHGLPAFTCSFGVAEAEQSEDFADAVSRADLALFEAKRTGRNRVVVYGALAEPPIAHLAAVTLS
jgi:diguanylate cyclase (GGDEF)-like protein